MAGPRCPRYEDCQLLTLAGVSPPYIGVERRFVAPFDVIERIDRRVRPRVVRAQRVAPRLPPAPCADNRPPGALKSALHARIDLLPHQLEPALAIVRGFGSRVLLADDVGLGKTIQAGLICAELLARGAIDRVLDHHARRAARSVGTKTARALLRSSATPSMRAALRRRSRNPAGRAQSVVDRAGRNRVDRLRQAAGGAGSVASCRWDLVIVDEAHGVGGDSDRHVGRAAARRAGGLCGPADSDAAQRRSPCVRVPLRPRSARRRIRFWSSGAAGAACRSASTAGPHHRCSAERRRGRMHRFWRDFTAAVRADRTRVARRLLACAFGPAQTRAVQRVVAAAIDRSPPRVAAAPGERRREPASAAARRSDGELTTADEARRVAAGPRSGRCRPRTAAPRRACSAAARTAARHETKMRRARPSASTRQANRRRVHGISRHAAARAVASSGFRVRPSRGNDSRRANAQRARGVHQRPRRFCSPPTRPARD